MRSALLLLPLPVSLALSIPLSVRQPSDESLASHIDTLSLESFRNLDPEAIAKIIPIYLKATTPAATFPDKKVNETAITSPNKKVNETSPDEKGVVEIVEPTVEFSLCGAGFGIYCSGTYNVDAYAKDGSPIYAISDAIANDSSCLDEELGRLWCCSNFAHKKRESPVKPYSETDVYPKNYATGCTPVKRFDFPVGGKSAEPPSKAEEEPIEVEDPFGDWPASIISPFEHADHPIQNPFQDSDEFKSTDFNPTWVDKRSLLKKEKRNAQYSPSPYHDDLDQAPEELSVPDFSAPEPVLPILEPEFQSSGGEQLPPFLTHQQPNY